MIQIFQKTGGIFGLGEIAVIKTVISLFYIISIKNKKRRQVLQNKELSPFIYYQYATV